ncbi:aldolase catalytic domain-containing protein [Salinimicrobium oceani]|uniref:Pyruvate carboxyltransferase domain-containing protein n=1 Tax=Salinimicrobium oceani TaxID=2722702 RepID=A0ABX1CYS7_9FLAO|nr:aldolase catalytic domain-containing protein [Salinimicrobium oceani]NJW53425.1 hypothetical protein [Salinimicrobium oceani]
MSRITKKGLSLLDCTLRDGGYYSDWDFSEDLVEEYIASMNALPVDFIEIGYRSPVKSGYYGAFYYLPEVVLSRIRKNTTKKLAVILDEKEIKQEDLRSLLLPCRGIVEVVRLAVAPQNLMRALALTKGIRNMGFKISFNLMYASTWEEKFLSELDLEKLERSIDYLYVVDSYGGMYPEQVKEIILKLKKNPGLKIGFHGHNNLEMALANSLAAIEAGADMIDATIGGMGRGAGNLKTELLLTVLHQQKDLAVDFDVLNNICSRFTQLKRKYNWGSHLAYMVSGAFSLPQRTVFSQLKKRYFSLNAIVSKVNTSPDKNSWSLRKIPFFKCGLKTAKVMLVGGGPGVRKYSEALNFYLEENSDVVIIHSSSKNMKVFQGLQNRQIHCMPGLEGKRFERIWKNFDQGKHELIFPPESYALSEYIPEGHEQNSNRLNKLSFPANGEISATAMALEVALQLSAKEILLVGYDGYDELVSMEEMELYEENDDLFQHANDKGLDIRSLTPTKYNVPVTSIFSLI